VLEVWKNLKNTFEGPLISRNKLKTRIQLAKHLACKDKISKSYSALNPKTLKHCALEKIKPDSFYGYAYSTLTVRSQYPNSTLTVRSW